MLEARVKIFDSNLVVIFDQTTNFGRSWVSNINR